LHSEDPFSGTAAVVRDRRRWPRQCDDGVVLVDDADRAAEPEEVEDAHRTRERDLRVHRGVLQPSSTALLPRVRDTPRLRPRPHPAGTHHHRKLATKSGNQTVGQVKMSPISAAVPPTTRTTWPSTSSASAPGCRRKVAGSPRAPTAPSPPWWWWARARRPRCTWSCGAPGAERWSLARGGAASPCQHIRVGHQVGRHGGSASDLGVVAGAPADRAPQRDLVVGDERVELRAVGFAVAGEADGVVLVVVPVVLRGVRDR